MNRTFACPACGRMMAFDSPRCPGCGHKPYGFERDMAFAKKNPVAYYVSLGLVLALFGWIFWACGGFASISKTTSKPATAEPQDEALRGDILTTRTTLIIENQDATEWRNVEVLVNAYGALTGGYVARVPVIRPGERKELALVDFVKGSKRFQPLAERVTDAIVSADLPSGRRGTFGQRAE